MEQQLKHRLTGATVLVSLGVIFIPMIFSPPENANETSIDITATPEYDSAFRSRIIPLDELSNGMADDEPENRFQRSDVPERISVEPEAPVRPLQRMRPFTTRSASEVAEEGNSAKISSPRSVANEKPSSSRTPPKTIVASIKPNKPKQSVLKAWAVQVGSFAKQKNALGLRDRLRAKGYRAFTKSIRDGGTTTTTRVFVGPTLRRDDALRASKKLHSDLSIEGIVMRYSKGR
jgi:DedD protein